MNNMRHSGMRIQILVIGNDENAKITFRLKTTQEIPLSASHVGVLPRFPRRSRQYSMWCESGDLSLPHSLGCMASERLIREEEMNQSKRSADKGVEKIGARVIFTS